MQRLIEEDLYWVLVYSRWEGDAKISKVTGWGGII
jgi:hypothetical protein